MSKSTSPTIKWLREHGLTLAAISTETGIPYGTLAQVMGGYRRMAEEKWNALQAAAEHLAGAGVGQAPRPVLLHERKTLTKTDATVAK